MADVELKRVGKHYGKTAVLHDIDLKVEDGEFVVFVGPSGCGKSTLLRLIAGLEDITSGDLFIDGQRMNGVAASSRGIAMVFQSYALYPHLSLFDNMAFSLQLAKRPKDEIAAEVQRAAAILHIDHLLERKPRELSGGQRQRVAIGRAIVRQPRVFLFDEPLSNLDAALRVKMRYEFARLHEELKTTMIYVTHDQVEAMTLADKIVVLSEGRIEQVGAPLDLYHRPANLFVAGFLGSPKMNFIRGKVAGAEADATAVELESGDVLRVEVDGRSVRPGDAVTIGIRPEHLSPANDTNRIVVKVDFVESFGDATVVYAGFPGAEESLTVKLPGDLRAVAGEPLALGMSSLACHLFDGSGAALPRRARASAQPLG